MAQKSLPVKMNGKKKWDHSVWYYLKIQGKEGWAGVGNGIKRNYMVHTWDIWRHNEKHDGKNALKAFHLQPRKRMDFPSLCISFDRIGLRFCSWYRVATKFFFLSNIRSLYLTMQQWRVITGQYFWSCFSHFDCCLELINSQISSFVHVIFHFIETIHFDLTS